MPKYVLGIDVGSATSKCVVLRDGEYFADSVVAVGAGTSGPQRAVDEVLAAAGIGMADIAACVATGYGRKGVQLASAAKTELSCHARGAAFGCPGVRTVIDIGGQDAKAICVDAKGGMRNFAMNDKCAAGTGRFLDVMARVLEMDIGMLEKADALSRSRVDISNTCTVFAESEVVSHLANGACVNDIVAGIHRSVASRVAGLAKRVGVTPPVVMTGGVALNGAVVKAMRRELGVEILVPEHPQTNGALGAALFANEL